MTSSRVGSQDRYVEKADHSGGIDHFRHGQAESENDSHGKGNGNLNHWNT